MSPGKQTPERRRPSRDQIPGRRKPRESPGRGECSGARDRRAKRPEELESGKQHRMNPSLVIFPSRTTRFTLMAKTGVGHGDASTAMETNTP